MMNSTYKGSSVIITSKFVQGNKKSFNNYINYLDRESAKTKTDYSLYNNYMDNSKKATSLFTENEDDISFEKKENLKESFKTAQKRGSFLWQDVVSFDNKWLEDNGIYDSKTKTVDEKRLKQITRLAMQDMLKNNTNNNPIWSAAIHHNTDNIHIHIATVEMNPNSNWNGFRKLKTLEKMKSVYVNNIMDRSKEHKMINDIIRNKIVNDKKGRKTFSAFNREFKKDFIHIYKSLPENKRYWNYGYQNINHIKPALNALTKKYIEKNYKKEYMECEKLLDKEVQVLKKTYGTGTENKYEKYKENKINDLYKRMGNAFLQEMKEYDKKLNSIKQNENYSPKMKRIKKSFATNQIKYGLDRIINSELKTSIKNQLAYEKLQWDIERSNSL